MKRRHTGDVKNKQDDTKEGHAEMASRYFQRTTMPTELARAAHKHLQSDAVQWTQNHFMGSPRPRREMYLVPDENALRVPYQYSGGTTLSVSPMSSDLVRQLVEWAESLSGAPCGGILANEYPDAQTALARGYGAGSSGVAPHSDDEHQSYLDRIIVSATLGAARRFVVRHKPTGHKTTMVLGHGDVVLMLPGAQELFTHEVPKESVQEKAASTGKFRYNLTFRPLCTCGTSRCLKKRRHVAGEDASQST